MGVPESATYMLTTEKQLATTVAVGVELKG